MRIELLTDFGRRDPYVASMRGVLASRTEAPVGDLSHEIAPFAIFEAAWFLKAAVSYWPKATIFVVVVDPGVGSVRRILAAERDGLWFVAPDNGLLTFVLDGARVVSVEREDLFLPGGSNTFHGRDRFAPVAAAIANGMDILELGSVVDDCLRLPYTAPGYEDQPVTGTIVSVDRFGNAITDIEVARLIAPIAELRVGFHVIRHHATTYVDGGDAAFLITGSSGTIEISMRNGSAAEVLDLTVGDEVTVGS